MSQISPQIGDIIFWVSGDQYLTFVGQETAVGEVPLSTAAAVDYGRQPLTKLVNKAGNKASFFILVTMLRFCRFYALSFNPLDNINFIK
jgi:hypothetical protein